MIHFLKSCIKKCLVMCGNGRISRIMADLLSVKLTGEKLDWGSCNLSEISEIRQQYISALRQADTGNYADLLNFVKSRN